MVVLLAIVLLEAGDTTVRLGQWISLLALAISAYILWQVRQVLLLVFAAVVLATILNRVVRSLQRRGAKRGMAIGVTIVFLLASVFSIFAIILPRLFGQIEQFSDVLPASLEQLQASYEWLQSRIPGQILGGSRLLDAAIQDLQAQLATLPRNIFVFLRGSINILLNLLLFLAATIMLLVNPLQYRRIFILAFPSFYRRRADQILDECEDSLVRWIRGTLLAMAVIAVVSYIGLLILGVPLPLVNALLAGILEFIPNVGPTLSVIPPALLALLDTPWKAVAVIVLYLLIQQFESLVLVPFVMKREVSLLPLFTILSVVVFSVFFGFLGLFLAIPLLIVLQIWLKEVLVHDILNPWQEKPKNLRQQATIVTDSAAKDK
ncbi:MAG: AI-2E family transporter [Leptolyngbyaceae cyanobacterium bins.302]|nr:AI-2E family transporter [Leptolyngbyaceae cyanobacterium bins.302]